MKKLLLLYISIIGFILPMWADFDPTKDTPPAVLPENIHPVQGKELNDKGVLDNPTFVLNNKGRNMNGINIVLSLKNMSTQ